MMVSHRTPETICSLRRQAIAPLLTRAKFLGLLSLIAFTQIAAPAVADTLRVPDDYVTIQSAIDAASAGDTVLVKPEIYRERISIRNGVIVRSEGDDIKGKLGLKRAETTIIDGGGENGEGAGVTMAEGSVFDGFTVTNVGHYDEAEWERHHATQGKHQSHEHIGQPGTPGIGVVGVNCSIRNNIVHHIGYTGIAIQGVDGKSCTPRIHRNICYRNMGGGIGSMKKSTAVIEENTCFQNFYAGIGHDDASPTVLNNNCYENIRAGIGISEGACPIVRGNKCYRNRRAGIGNRTGASTRPTIEDNACYENDMTGIGAEEHASPIIRSNRCFRNKLAGIGSRTHAIPTIIGNECYENDTVGIGQDSDAVTMLIGNHCHHNKEAGIGFATCETGRSVVLRNRVIDNAKVAIGINSGWQVSLLENELSREGGMPPIVMVFAGADAIFTDNVIRGGGVAGIRAAGKVRAVHNKFVGTSLRKAGPPNFAVWALPGSDITMTGNTAHGWRHALHASEATVHAIHNSVSNFQSVAFVVQNSVSPAIVFGNTAASTNPRDTVLTISGKLGIVTDNHVVNSDR